MWATILDARRRRGDRGGVRAFLAALVTGALLGQAGPAVAAPVVLRVGTVAPEGSPWAEATQSAAKQVAKASKDTVHLRVFLAGVLGDEPQLMASLAAGKLDIYSGTAVAAEEAIPELSVFELPFLFKDDAEVERVMKEIFPVLSRVAAGRGFRMLAVTAVGFKHLGTPIPIESLADLRKVRLRSQPSALQERMWTRAGVPHTAIGQIKVLDELVAGTVNAFDAAITWMYAASWHTRIKHLTLFGHVYQLGVFMAGPSVTKQLTPAQQRAAFRGLEGLGPENNKAVRQVERSLLATLPGLGVTVGPAPKALRSEFEVACKGLRAEWRRGTTEGGRALLDAIERATGRRE